MIFANSTAIRLAGSGRLWLAGVRLVCTLALFYFLLIQLGLDRRLWRETSPAPGLEATTSMAAPPGLLGVTTAHEGLDAIQRQAALQRLADHGFRWVRQRMDWAALEPASGVFDWRWTDQWLTEVNSAGLTPVVVLDGSPAWARDPLDRAPTDNPLAPPADVDDFARFTSAFARRYADRVRFYQVWDEPNIAPHWGNRHIEAVHYAQLLAAASAAIRAADPDAVILAAALAPTTDRGHLAQDEIYFWQRMKAAGAGKDFDVVAIQPFGFGYAPDNSRQSLSILNFQRAAFLRRGLVQMGWEDKPVWAVRFGWNTNHRSPWGTVSQANQEAYARDAVTLVRQHWPWLVALGWAIDQPAVHPLDPAWGFALNDGLLAALSQPISGATTLETTRPRVSFSVGATVVALALLTWRMYAAASLLPWRRWRRRVQQLSNLESALIWGMLLVVYYLATWPPLIVLCWMCAALLALWRPNGALWVALLALPFIFQHKEVHMVDVTLTVSPMLAAALILVPLVIACLLVHLKGNPRQTINLAFRQRPMVALFLLLMLAWAPVNLLSALNVWHWTDYWRGVAELVVAPLVIAAAVILLTRVGATPKSILSALFAGGVLVAVIGLARWLAGQGVEVDGVLRLTATQFSPNHTALYLTRTFFLGVGLALAAHGRARLFWLALTALVGSALLLTASRGALLLGAPVGGAVVIVLLFWHGRNRPYGVGHTWFVAPLIFFGAFLVAVAAMEAQARLFNTETVEARTLLWQTAWRLWQVFPLLGVGVGGFFWTYPAYLDAGSELETNLLHPHNVWLEAATAWGAIGVIWLVSLLVLFSWLLIRTVQRNTDRDRWLALGLLAALLAGLAHAQVDAFLVLGDLAGWFFAAVGLAASWGWEHDEAKCRGMNSEARPVLHVQDESIVVHALAQSKDG